MRATHVSPVMHSVARFQMLFLLGLGLASCATHKEASSLDPNTLPPGCRSKDSSSRRAPENATVGVAASSIVQLEAIGIESPRWILLEKGGGAISRDGRYSAPSGPGWYHIAAIDPCDPKRCASFDINVYRDRQLTSLGLIQNGVDSGELSSDMAFAYRILAEFRDPRLPEEFRGNDTSMSEPKTFMYGGETYPKLKSSEAKALAAPYFESSQPRPQLIPACDQLEMEHHSKVP